MTRALRDLPPRPHLDHLKKQAKELLDAYERGEPEARERVRAALPSFAGLSDAALARAPFALHDAQSAIAREYGFRSWNELRAEVAQRSGGAFPEVFVRSLLGQPVPDTVMAALRAAGSRRQEAAAALSADVPEALPLVAARNALLVPRGLGPFHLGRAASVAAVEAALAATPPLLALFAQRAPETEDVRAEALHPTGCLALVHRWIPLEAGAAFVVLEGVRWIALRSVEPAQPPGQHLVARVAPADVEDLDDAAERDALMRSLRDRARRLASAMPDAGALIALLDSIEDADHLADLVVGNLPCSVEDKARYASHAKLADRLRAAIALCDAQRAGG